jgi:hypothetical protein
MVGHDKDVCLYPVTVFRTPDLTYLTTLTNDADNSGLISNDYKNDVILSCRVPA